MQNFVRFLKELRAYWRVMALVIVLTLITASLSIPLPWVMGYLTDRLSDKALAERPYHGVNLPGVFPHRRAWRSAARSSATGSPTRITCSASSSNTICGANSTRICRRSRSASSRRARPAS